MYRYDAHSNIKESIQSPMLLIYRIIIFTLLLFVLLACSTYKIQPEITDCGAPPVSVIKTYNLVVSGTGYRNRFDLGLQEITESILLNSKKRTTLTEDNVPGEGMHLIIVANQKHHGGASVQEWLTGLSFGLIPSWTYRNDFYKFKYLLYLNGNIALNKEYSINRSDYGHITLLPFGIAEMTHDYYRPAYSYYREALNNIVLYRCN